jgi:carboxyl-terminal processing protease
MEKVTKKKKVTKKVTKPKKIEKVEEVKEIEQKDSTTSIKTVVTPVVEEAKVTPVQEEPIVEEKVEEKQPENKVVELKSQQNTSEKRNLSFSTKEIILLIFAVALVSLALGLLLGKFVYKATDSTSESLSEIEKAYQDIKTNYPNATDKDIISGAVEGMLSAVGDPYATVIDSNSSFMLEVDGEYYGLGIEITTKAAGEIYVSKVFENSGAADAGIQVGDKILAVDDKDLTSGVGSDFSTYVLNSSNTQFTVKVNRNGTDMSFVVTKKKVTIPSVTTKTLTNNGKSVAYIDVSIFSGTTYDQFKEALKNADTSNGLIIDLRGNTGGRLDVVVNMLSELLDSKQIIYQTDTNGTIDKFYSTGNKDFANKIVVLVDNNSASASEIMTAALQQDLSAIVVGKTTYGKGTVQQLKTLSSGVQYKVTTKKWLTPNGTSINGTGIKPDYDVDQSTDYYSNATDANDAQLQKAIQLLTE